MIGVVVRFLKSLFASRPKTSPSATRVSASTRLHIPRSVVNELREITRPNELLPEPLAFLRVRFASEDSKTIVVPVGLMAFPAVAYVDGPAGANFSTAWAIDVANAGISDNVGLMLVHSHGGVGMPIFSGIDAKTNRSIMAALAIGLENAPFGAVVLSDTDARCVVTANGGLSDAHVVVVPDRFGELRVPA